MNKKDALYILIEHSSLLSPILKDRIRENIPSMSEEDITALGEFFSAEQEQLNSSTEKNIETISAILKRLEQEEK
jgi:hypothetical protein